MANIDEDIPDSQIVSCILNGLPDSYQGFTTTLRLVAMGNANYYSFDQLVALLLQEEQSRVNRNASMHSDQAFAANDRNKGRFQKSVPKNTANNQPSTSSSQGDQKKKKRCNYCRKPGHEIAECRKRIASEKKKKEAGLSVTTTSGTDANTHEHANEQANYARDQNWGFIVQCHYNPPVHDTGSHTCMAVSASTWFFDSGASKHITSSKTLFTSLADAPKGGSVTCQQCILYC